MSLLIKCEKELPRSPEYKFWCPGCNCYHWFKTTGSGPCWSWNNDPDKPTINPSILNISGNAAGPTRCHIFVRDGKIQYLKDCTHDLAGKTVNMQDEEK